MYGRTYVVPMDAITISAVQDLLLIRPASNMPVVIHKVVVTADNSETNQQIKVSVNRLTATLTVTGGTSVTAVKKMNGDAAASFTATRNHTTQTTTNGSTQKLNPEGFPSQGGFEYLPDIHERPVVVNGEGFVVTIDESPGGIPMSAYAVVEEIG